MRARIAPVLLAVACSEYGFDGEDPVCLPYDPAPYEPVVTPDCRVEPAVGLFDPVVEWRWRDNPTHPGSHQVDAQPVVADINADGTPDVVFAAFEGAGMGTEGAVVAVSGTGETLWSVRAPGGAVISATSGVAIGDLEGDGSPEILVASWQGLVCLDHTGALEWKVEVQSDDLAMPAIADLEFDGLAEVVLGRTVINHDGTKRWAGQAGMGRGVSGFAVDLDRDGQQEVVAGNTVYDSAGDVRLELAAGDGWSAVADFDRDGTPEIVLVEYGVVSLWGLDGVRRWRAPLYDNGGGAPTIADFDGDGVPEIGVAGMSTYTVVDTDGALLWQNGISDFSSAATGSSVFDFEGDGAAEVVYGDEHTLWIFDGATGTVELAWEEHSSGTLFEYPVIVDIDRDGSAEIVVASNDFRHGEAHGITVIGDRTSSWAPARPIWNQHAYYIANIGDDARVPPSDPEWPWTNSFRAGNALTPVGFDRPDLVVGAPDVCTWECWDDRAEVWIPVENRGQAPVGDLDVALIALDGPDERTVRVESLPTLRAGATAWLGPISVRPEDFGPDGLTIRVDADATWAECDEANNAHTITVFPCE